MENVNILLLHINDSGVYLYFIWVYKCLRFISLGGCFLPNVLSLIHDIPAVISEIKPYSIGEGGWENKT